MSFGAIVVGAIAGTAAVTLAGIYWSHEDLITPHGWVITAGTTVCAIGCVLGPLGLARARDREIQGDAVDAVERLVATARVLEPLIGPMLSHADLITDMASLTAKVQQNTSLLTTIERRHAVFDKVIEAVVRHGMHHQVSRGDGEQFDRDTAWLADMAEAMELGRKLEQRGGDQPPATSV